MAAPPQSCAAWGKKQLFHSIPLASLLTPLVKGLCGQLLLWNRIGLFCSLHVLLTLHTLLTITQQTALQQTHPQPLNNKLQQATFQR